VGEVLRLLGCRPEPLGSYLKGLGVLRLVGEQADTGATAFWDGDCLVLSCSLGRGELEDFFTNQYRPTPLVAPWNGGSGFSPKDTGALEALRLVQASTNERLALYRQALGTAQGLVAEEQAEGWTKEVLIEACRGQLPEASVAWLDAAVVMTSGKPRFPPLLGTGGNDGRMDFSANFMHRLCDVLGLRQGRGAPKPETARQWLAAALFADVVVAGLDKAVGQFDPGAAGGANSSPMGEAPSVVNPWDFVLMLEGALAMAGGAARRLGFDTEGKAAMPFMVDSSPVGYPSSAGSENSRGELWLPLWHHPATFAEIVQLVGEGRSEWRGRQARSGLDMARAVATLGVDRGIDSFVRHAFLERRGLATAAVAVGRLDVRRRPGVPLLGQLDQWLGRTVRDPPAGVAAAVRLADRAMFDLTTLGGPEPLQLVLAAMADAELAVARSPSFRQRTGLQPLQRLAASAWLSYLDDGTPEFRVAAALASLRDKDGACLRFLLRPVKLSERRSVDWSDGPPVSTFGLRPLTEVLAQTHARRAVEVVRRSPAAGEDIELPGIQTAFARRLPAPLADVAEFVNGDLDDDRIEQLLSGLLLLDWSALPAVGHWFEGRPAIPLPVPPSWALLAPFFHGRPLREGRLRLLPEATWVAQLAAGRRWPVLDAALRRLRMARLDPAPHDAAAMARTSPGGARLGAALLVPISGASCELLLRRLVPPPIDAPIAIDQPA
jgi:CRISPR-associated protein Csx17